LCDTHFCTPSSAASEIKSGVYVGPPDGQTRKGLVHASTTAVYAPPGYLLFVDGDTQLGQVFDAERLEVTGQPFLVAEHAGRNTAFMSAVSASRTGAIAYASTLSQSGRLASMDREGNEVGSPGIPEGDYTDLRLSSDEGRLATSLVNPESNAVEVHGHADAPESRQGRAGVTTHHAALCRTHRRDSAGQRTASLLRPRGGVATFQISSRSVVLRQLMDGVGVFCQVQTDGDAPRWSDSSGCSTAQPQPAINAIEPVLSIPDRVLGRDRYSRCRPKPDQPPRIRGDHVWHVIPG
jgi:hypothetical protein